MSRLAPIAVLCAALTLSASAAAGSGHPRLPSGVQTIDIRSAAGVTAHVTRPAAIRAIVKWFDALPRFVPRPCPYPVYKPSTVTFKFRGPRNALTTAVDRMPGTCSGSIEYGNDLDVKYPALADDDFVARVSRLLGVDFDPGERTAANERAAGRDASSLLRLVDLPRGSRRVTTPPAKALRSAASTPGTSALVDRHRIWKVRESVHAVDAFEHAHRPPGSRETEDGVSDYGPNPSESLTFSFPPLAGQVATRQVVVNIVPLENGWTGIRVDAQDVWVVARPGSERVPAATREIDVGSHRITAAPKVRTIIRWFDALQVAQGGVFHCPMIRGPLVTIDFRSAGGKLLAKASGAYNGGVSGACNPIAFSVGGHSEMPLLGGRFLVRVKQLAG